MLKGNLVFEEVVEDFQVEKVRYLLQLQAKRVGSSEWVKLREVHLDFSGLNSIEFYNLNEMYDVFPYRVERDA